MINITYFVHSITSDNETGIATGWLPGELSAEGIKRAHKLVDQIKGKDFDIVLCSDLHRAVQTAEIVFGKTHKVIQDERLREANYGDLNGKKHNFKDTMENFIDTPFPNGESYRDVGARMKSFCDFLKQTYDGKHIAIIAHQAPQLALEVILNGKTWPEAITTDWRKQGAWQPGWPYTIA